MARENMKMEEGFSVNVTRKEIETKPRHHAMAWGSILAALAGLGYWLVGGEPQMPVMQERPSVTETLQHKIGGVLNYEHIRGGQVIAKNSLPIPNQIINAGETALRDCFGGTGTPTCTVVQNFKYHGVGTSSAAIAETDTGCTTELTTQYNPDNTRATGSQTNNGANIYRTVGTNTVDASVTIQEFCLMSQAATGGGTMWTRILTGGVSLSSGDSIQTTYDLTIE